MAFVLIAAPSTFAQASGEPSNHTADDSALVSLLTKAQGDIDNQDYGAAAEKYQDYLAQHPDDAQVHFQLGYCYTALQKNDQARAEYQKATELDPKMAPAFLNLGLTELSSDPAAAVTPLGRAAELMPDQERPKLLLATALAHSGETDQAIAQYQAAAKIDPSDGELHRDFGATLFAANRPADAEKELRAALAANAQDAGANRMLGECLLAEKKYDEAATQLASYLKSQPGDDKTRFSLVSILIDAAKYDDAIAELDRATPAAQGSLAALELRFNALEGAKRYDEALATLAKAEAVAPGEADIHAKMAHLFLDRKDYARASQEFVATLKLQPANGDALAGLVNAEYSAKDYVDTVQAIDLLSKQKTLSTQTLFIQADCYDKLGKKPEALDAYEKFLAANTDRNNDMYFAAAERARILRRELGKH
jgi:Tfp pilus assembly protein PilF